MMTLDEFRNAFPIPLNEQQLSAVQTVQGPVLLLAVPGSGKTTVLVTRLGYMIYCCGIQPERILTLTYTVAATHDMANRFQTYFGNELGERLEFRTINGICARIISYYGRKIGKNPFQLVTDEKRISTMLSSLYQQVEKTYPTESDLKTVRTLITYIKNSMLTKDEIKMLEKEPEVEIRISQIYQRYVEEMRHQGWMDYDDQMTYAYTILRKSPETLQYFQRQYPYICVDEAQDTSKIQHGIISLLAGSEGNLFMVGDEDQSIYGFRAAYPKALLSFETDHPGARVLLMEENFRSNAKIVAAADRFIQKNAFRHTKHMRSSRRAGTDIRVVSLKSRAAQYSYLEKVAENCQEETAVLFRDHESALPLIDLLERKGIPYGMRRGELTFFTHRVVLDIQNIIRYAMNPRDTQLFLQIYYKLNLYINKQNALSFAEMAEEKRISVLEAAIRYGKLPGYTIGSIKTIQTHLQNMLEEPADKAIYRIVHYMGYGEYLERAGIGDGKLFILRILAARETSPQKFVERLGVLQETIREKVNDPACPFILSTIHASKGLEYHTVYLLDVADGIFPDQIPEKTGKQKKNKEYKRNQINAEQEHYEEERRLFYVGVTRAKDNLILFRTPPSSVFITDLLEAPEIKSMQTRVLQPYGEFCDSLGEGIGVIHKKFGKGIIVKQEGDLVTIQFPDKRRIMSTKLLWEKDLLQIES